MKAEVEKSLAERQSSPIGPMLAGLGIGYGEFQKIAEVACSKVMANVLSDEQKKTWKEMLGKPCDPRWWTGE